MQGAAGLNFAARQSGGILPPAVETFDGDCGPRPMRPSPEQAERFSRHGAAPESPRSASARHGWRRGQQHSRVHPQSPKRAGVSNVYLGSGGQEFAERLAAAVKASRADQAAVCEVFDRLHDIASKAAFDAGFSAVLPASSRILKRLTQCGNALSPFRFPRRRRRITFIEVISSLLAVFLKPRMRPQTRIFRARSLRCSASCRARSLRARNAPQRQRDFLRRFHPRAAQSPPETYRRTNAGRFSFSHGLQNRR